MRLTLELLGTLLLMKLFCHFRTWGRVYTQRDPLWSLMTIMGVIGPPRRGDYYFHWCSVELAFRFVGSVQLSFSMIISLVLAKMAWFIKNEDCIQIWRVTAFTLQSNLSSAASKRERLNRPLKGGDCVIEINLLLKWMFGISHHCPQKTSDCFTQVNLRLRWRWENKILTV